MPTLGDQREFQEKVRVALANLDWVRKTLEANPNAAKIDGLDAGVKSLKAGVSHFENEVIKTARFQGAIEFIDAINASVGNIAGAVHAARRGDEVGTAASSLTSIATLTKGLGAAILVAGPEAFPAAFITYLLGGIIELAGSICELFRREEISLIDQISTLLVRARSKELAEHLAVAADQFQKWEHSLQGGSLQAKPWGELAQQFDLRGGLAVTFTDVAGRWMLDSENQQAADSWVAVFDAYATCMNLRSRVYFSQYASWLRYRSTELTELGDKNDPASSKRRIELRKMDEDARTDMKEYFDGVRIHFSTLQWLGRKMAPAWHKGSTHDIYRSTMTITEEPRDSTSAWTAKNLDAKWDEIIVLPRNEVVENGVVVWGWNSELLPYYTSGTDGWHAFDKFKDINVACIDVAFAGSTLGGSDNRNPDATPATEYGIYALLAMEKTTNAMHLKYFMPDKPTNEFSQSWPLTQPPKEFTIRQIRVRPTPGSVEAYFLGKHSVSASADHVDQIYRIDQKGTTRFGPGIDGQTLRIYLTADAVWALGPKKIRFRAHEAKANAVWEVIDNPSGLNGDWEYKDIHPGDDGLLLATIGDRYFAYTLEDGWREQYAERGYYDRMARLQLSGFPMFRSTWESSKGWERAALPNGVPL
jgi:hypothetical protein